MNRCNCDETPIVKLGYDRREAAAMVGCDVTLIDAAINSGDLVLRRFGEFNGAIAHYELELWLLGRPDYLKSKPEYDAKREAARDQEQAQRLTKSQERREAKAARAALKAAQDTEDARVAADLAELERLRAERQ